MLALIYFALAACVGDFLCRRFYQFESAAHRFARSNPRWPVGKLLGHISGGAGFLLDTTTYFVGQSLILCRGGRTFCPGLNGKAKILTCAFSEKLIRINENLYLTRPQRIGRAPDWLLIAGYVVLVSWMMFASFNAKEGKLQIANPEYNDSDRNTALMQSFAVGHNFPTEYPHFSGDRIRYHFLFYFQAGFVEFLGLDPAWSLNLLSITTNVDDARDGHDFGEVLFDSRQSDPRVVALFLFSVALLRPVSSHAGFCSRGYSSDHPSTRLSSDDFSVSRRSLGVRGLR